MRRLPAATHTLSIRNKTGNETLRFQVEFSHEMWRLNPDGTRDQLGDNVRIWEVLRVPRNTTKTHANMPSAPCSVRTTTDGAISDQVIITKFYTKLEPLGDAGGEVLKTGHIINGREEPLSDDYVVP